MPDNPEKSSKTHPDKDRRLHARQRIHSLSYVKMGDSNGGIVLNISEGGISVQAAAALDPDEPVTLSLEIPRVRNRVEVRGEVAWLSASKKEAGIRFVDLPESTLKQIQKWMAREASPEQFEDETDPVGEEQEAPVAAARVNEAAVEPATSEAGAVEAAPDEDGGVLELNEANILSADEIKKLAPEPNGVRRTTVAVSEEEVEQEIEEEAGTADQDEADATDAAAVAANSGAAEAEEEVEEEAEVKQLSAQGAKASAEIKVVREPGTKPATRGAEEAEEESDNEDELIQAFGPPVVPFERRPNTPFSSMNALAGGARSAQNLAIAPSLLHDVRTPFVESVVAAQEPAPESGWKVFTIQLQTGWFLAALVLLLALISFIAGMAVRRGALNGMMGEQQEMLVPRSSPANGAISHIPAPAGGSTAADGTNAAEAASPLSIEIVDLANHRWVIPASTAVNRSNVTQPADTGDNSAPRNTTPTNAGASQGSTNAAGGGASPANAGTNSGMGSGTNSGKGGVPLVLSLPETPISATGSVAISSQRSVPVPADGSKAAQNGRNLQVGQLVNLVEPVYPAEAVQQKIEGTVKLHAVIGTDGVIESLAQVSGPQVLVNASMAAVRNWRYSPTRMNGQAIETQEDISFVFRLPN
jgi:TonB family protein